MRIAVIGGGVLGSLVALGLSRDGHEVDLLERRSTLFAGASSAGEGKVHLGHVYALGSDETSDVMLRAALSFDRSVDALVGRPLDWSRIRGERFRYLVAEDSMVGVDGMVAHGERLEAMRAAMMTEEPGLTYLGSRLATCRFERVVGEARALDVEERTVDVAALWPVLAGEISTRRTLRVRTDSTVVDVEPAGSGWRTGISDGDGLHREFHDVIVNCAWDDAARLDRAAGAPQDGVPNLRLRTFVHGTVALEPCAYTIVHGPYGDLVVHRDGRLYAAWYPSGVLGFAVADSSPDEWATVLDDPSVRRDQIESTLDALRRFVPALGPVADATVHARVVVARGETDIDDPRSTLHRRDDHGVVAGDGWISARSTKLTTAPVTACEVVDEVRRMSS